MSDLAGVRKRYADELKKLTQARSSALVRAFATVPRERYLGPGPWQIFRIPGGYKPTPDPSDLYANVLVGIKPERMLNNGEPSLHMHLIDEMNPQPGEHVVHIGCGTGYYSAIFAECVTEAGAVTAIEIDEELAARASRNLAPLSQVEVVSGNGATADFPDADGIYVNAGASHPYPVWLDRLRPGGRLVLPLTGSRGFTLGGVILITREEDRYGARFISPVIIFPCVAGRAKDLEPLLDDAFQRGRLADVRSLRRETHPPGETCWLHAPDFCLSTASELSSR